MATVTTEHASTSFSVVIPAQGEAALSRCLQSFVPGLREGEAEVVVVAYGRLDASASVAAGHAGVRVIELDGGTRSTAMNIGDAAAHTFPRLYVDPTAEVSVEGLRLLAESLSAPGRNLAVPHEQGSGPGVYGLSAAARARFTDFPDTTDDREFIDTLFAVTQRSPEPLAAAHVTVDGVAFDRITETEVIERVLSDLTHRSGGLLLTPNIDILRQLRRPQHADLAHRARLVVADGAPIVWASRVLGTPLPERVTGASLIWSLSGGAAAAGHRVMLVGGDEGVAERAAARLQNHYPALRRVPWHFPPFGFDEDEDGLAEVIRAIAAEKADIVFLGLGFPRQERLALRLQREFPGTWFVGCGGSITMLAGDRSRAPQWMQAAGLEWFHRLVQEPRRLFRRYLVDDVPFALAMLTRAALGRITHRHDQTTPASAVAVAVAQPVNAEPFTVAIPAPRPSAPVIDLRDTDAVTRTGGPGVRTRRHPAPGTAH